MTHWTRHLRRPFVFPATCRPHRPVRTLAGKVSLSPAPAANVRFAPLALHAAGRGMANSQPASSSDFTVPSSPVPGTAVADPTGPIPTPGIQSDSRSEGGDGETLGGEEKVVLPEELMRNVVALSCDSTVAGGSCNVYVIGTCHVSEDSCREVQALINYLKPQAVFLELCSSRVAALTDNVKTQVPTMGEMVHMWTKNNSVSRILYRRFLATVASELEVIPGAEFRVAYEEAMKYGGRVILGDRPIHITLRRLWGCMPRWHKIKILYSLLLQSIFLPSLADVKKMLKNMDDVDAITLLIQEMSKAFPTLMETLVHERDRYMSSTLLQAGREHNLVVAVVGKGHLQGIKNHWQQPIELDNLLEIPSERPSKSARLIFFSIGVALAATAMFPSIYLT